MRLSVGITGHRDNNPVFREHIHAVEHSIDGIFTVLDTHHAPDLKPRLYALLSLGTDMIAVETALRLHWQVTAVLPFGARLNIAINAQPLSIADAHALFAGHDSCSPQVTENAARIAAATRQTRCFELSDRDATIESLFLDAVASSQSDAAAQAFAVAASERAALAAQVMIEQIDLLIAVWDGTSPGPIGGTRHTIVRALETGITVLWIDAANPQQARMLETPEALARRWTVPVLPHPDAICAVVAKLTACDDPNTGKAILEHAAPPTQSRTRFHAYRWLESIFAGELRAIFRSHTQKYAHADAVIADRSANPIATLRDSSGMDAAWARQIEQLVVRRFAIADAVASYLSDAYRGGMVTNLVLAAFAVIGGIAYLPLFDAALKWPFALFEFILLAIILSIIAIGRKRDWHGRWFQTRRVAEYLRQAPMMLLLGVGRPASAWPHSDDTQWPEDYVRSILREIGLPRMQITGAALRAALDGWIGSHVAAQRSYHLQKAARLDRIDHHLERISERLFLLAMLVVATYLGMELAAAAGWLATGQVRHTAKLFTFLGVALPTLGGALAGIHYFSDFGRFAAISKSTANRLEAIAARIADLRAAPDDDLDYSRVASIVRAIDETVVSEIEHWQDVFGGKHISVPV